MNTVAFTSPLWKETLHIIDTGTTSEIMDQALKILAECVMQDPGATRAEMLVRKDRILPL